MLKIGDNVRVIGKCAEGWVSDMDDMIGNIYKIEDFDDGYWVIDGFLFYSEELEKVPDINDNKMELKKLLRKLSDGFNEYKVSGSESDFWKLYYSIRKYIEEIL